MYRFEVGPETFWIYATKTQGAIDLATAHVADGVDAKAMISLINERDAMVVRQVRAAEWGDVLE